MKLVPLIGLMFACTAQAVEPPSQMEETMYIIGLYDGCTAVLVMNHKTTTQSPTEHAINDLASKCRGLVISVPAYRVSDKGWKRYLLVSDLKKLTTQDSIIPVEIRING